MKGKRIGVLMGGFGGEREVALASGKAVTEALRRKGYEFVAPIDVGDDLVDRLRDERIEVAFVALHGPVGEDGIVQGVLEFLRIPYTGSGVRASAVAMDKIMSKRIFEIVGIPTAPWEIIERDEPRLPEKIVPPLVVKPSDSGSSLAVTLVIDSEDEKLLEEAIAKALNVSSHVIIEKYVPGSEITVGVLNGEPLGCVEIRPKSGFYDYRNKYTAGCTEYLAPAPISPDKATLVQQIGAAAYRALGCKGAARVDFRLPPQGYPVALEVNTIPGLTSVSLLPKSAAVVGIDFDELIERMLANAGYERSE